MADNSETLYADLAEEVYQRNALDIPLTYQSINVLTGTDLAPARFLDPTILNSIGLVGDFSAGNGMVYTINQDGFAAQVLQNGSQYIVIFRGTDLVGLTSSDTGDLSADYSLSQGSPNAGQLTAMQRLMQTVIAQAGGPSNVTVAGQSLGGGLAALAGAEFGVQAHVFDPAPFAAQLWTDAITAAATSTLNSSGTSIKAQLDALSGLSSSLYQPTLSGIQDFLSHYSQLIPLADITAFTTYLQSTYLGYLSNLSLITASRITGEALSNHDAGLGWLIGLNSTQFDSETLGAPLGLNYVNNLVISSYDLGLPTVSSSESIALHHPSLIALLTAHSDFGSVTAGDSAIRDALFDESQITGAVNNGRADPTQIPTIGGTEITITSKVPGGFADPSILYRELTISADQYNSFFLKFGSQIDSGTAALGLSAATFDPNSIHSGLVDFGLEVIRDNQGTFINGVFTPNQTALNVFGDIGNQHYAVVRLSDITSTTSPAYTAGIDLTLQNDIVAQPGAAYLTKSMFSADTNAAPHQDWEVLVVQAGSVTTDGENITDAAMTYAPTGDDTELSHLIFGGNGGDTITTSKAGDFIIGGSGGNTINGVGGDDVIFAGDGDDTINLLDPAGEKVDGGLGHNVVNYHSDHGISVQVSIPTEPNLASIPLFTVADAVSDASDVLIDIDKMDLGTALNNTLDFRDASISDPIHLYAAADGAVTTCNFAFGTGSETIAGINTIYASLLDADNFDFTAVSAGATCTIDLGAGNSVIDGGQGTLFINGEGHGTLILPSSWQSYNISFDVADYFDIVARAGNGGTDDVRMLPTVDFAPYAIAENTSIADAGLEFGNTAMPIVPGSVHVVSSDGHAVQLTAANGAIGIDPSQFAYLDEGQSTVLSVSYQIQEGTQATTFQDTVTINGVNQAPLIDVADSTLTGGVTRAPGSDDSIDPTIKFTDPNIGDTHTATISGFSLNSTGNAMPAATIAALQNALTLDPVAESDGGGSIGWQFAIPDAFVSSLPAGQFIDASYVVSIDDGHGGTTSTTVDAVVAGSPNFGYPYGDNATVIAYTSMDSSAPALVAAGANANITLVGAGNGYADIDLGQGSLLTIENGTFSLYYQNTNVNILYAGAAVFGVDLYLDQGVMDYTVTGQHLVDPVTGQGFSITTFSRPGSPDEVIEEGDQNATPITPLNFHFLDFDGNPFAFQQEVQVVAAGQNVGLTSPLQPLSVNLQMSSQATAAIDYIDRRPQEKHSSSVVYDQAMSGAPQIGSMTATIATDSGAAAGTLNLSYSVDPSVLHGMLKSAVAESYVQDYDVSIVDQEGQAFTQTEAVNVSGYALTAITGQSSGSVTENSSTTASGALTLTDYDPLDVHTPHVSFVSISGGGQTGQIGQLTAIVNSDTGANKASGTAGWSYSVDPAVLAALPENQTIIETFQVAFDDGAGNSTAPQNVTITIQTQPDNSPAAIQFNMSHAGTVSLSTVIEHTSGTGTQTATGKFFFADTNLRDLDTASYSTPLGTVAGQLTLAQPVKDSDGYYEVDWSYTVTDAQIAAYDGVNKEIASYFNISISDGRGHTVTAPSTLTIWAEQDGPVLLSGGSGLAVTAGSSLTTESGTNDYLFSDALTSSRHAVSAVDFVSSQAPGGVQIGSFAAHVARDANVISPGFSGEVAYTFTVNDSDLSFLNDGQSVKEFWSVVLTSTTGQTLTETIPVTITRSNQMAVSGATTAASISADASGTGTETTGAHFAFSDAAKADVHTVSAAFIPAGGNSSLGTLTPVVVTDTTGSGTGGSVTWAYQVSDAVLDALGVNQTVQETWQVAVSDGHGGVTTQDVVISLTGPADHAPVTTPFTIAAVSQASAPVVIANPLSHATDPDGDTLSLVANSETVTSSDGHTVAFSVLNGAVTVNPSQFAYLGAGQHVDLTLGYDVTDGTDVTHGTGTLEVVGLDDAPTAVSAGTITRNDTSAPDTFAPAVGFLAASDPDGNDVTYASNAGTLLVVASNGYYTVNAIGEYAYFYNSVYIESHKSGAYTDLISGIATDADGLRSSASTVSIAGSIADDAPYAMTWSTGGTINDHPVNGTVVGTLAVTDPDGGDASPWSLVDDDGGRFAINAVTGVVTVANGSLLDYATASDYAIVVKEADGSVSDQETMHVSLIQMPAATITGTSGADTLTGTSGNDVIVGLGGGDTINAGSGDDIVMAGSGHDVLDGGTGNDTISFADLTAGVGTSLGFSMSGGVSGTNTNFENLIGTQYNDSITGTPGNNVLDGEGGNDAIRGDLGNDTIDGGPGFDTVYFDVLQSAMTANLQTQTLGGAASGTTITNVEGVIGGNGDDTLIGFTSAPSYLGGAGGNDILIGGTGNDQENGGTGHDIIYGTLGADFLQDPDDAVFDYSGSPTAVALIWTGPLYGPNYLGYGGFAEGDHVAINTGSTVHFEFDLTPYNDLMSLVPNSNQTIYAGAGDDTILGADVVDPTIHNVNVIYGGDGFDTIHPGGDGYDTIDFGAGGGVLDYALHGGAGLTYVDFEWAEPGGTSTVHMYNVAAGSTTVTDFGATTVVGDFGTFVGTSAADIINGNSQANTINGGGGLDVINGGGGDDAITGIGTIHGNDGNDTIVIAGTDTTSAVSQVYGDAGNDIITLTANSVTNVAIYGGAGDDYIDVSHGSSGTIVHGDAGADTIIANSAVTLSYGDSTSSIAINATNGILGDAMGDVVLGSPVIVGSNFGDTFTNTADELHLGTGNNTVVNNTGIVYGNTGNDIIIGTTGADTIHTGGGLDQVTGGLGNDTIYFDHPTGVTSAAQLNYSFGDGTDTINTFLQGSDSINISRLAGHVDPVVSLSQTGGDTDVHVTWYTTAPVQGQPLPAHSDADIMLHGILLTTFAQNQDYHVV